MASHKQHMSLRILIWCDSSRTALAGRQLFDRFALVPSTVESKSNKNLHHRVNLSPNVVIDMFYSPLLNATRRLLGRKSTPGARITDVVIGDENAVSCESVSRRLLKSKFILQDDPRCHPRIHFPQISVTNTQRHIIERYSPPNPSLLKEIVLGCDDNAEGVVAHQIDHLDSALSKSFPNIGPHLYRIGGQSEQDAIVLRLVPSTFSALVLKSTSSCIQETIALAKSNRYFAGYVGNGEDSIHTSQPGLHGLDVRLSTETGPPKPFFAEASNAMQESSMDVQPAEVKTGMSCRGALGLDSRFRLGRFWGGLGTYK